MRVELEALLKGNQMLAHADLFAGIGGFSYGLKQTGGYETQWYCENEKYAQEVLLSRMLDGRLDTAPIWPDINTLDGKPWRGRIDILTGGFPCIDISVAGKQAGIKGKHSSLWFQMLRLIDEIRPRYFIVENTPNLRFRGIDALLGSVADLGSYEVAWSCISARQLGAPHKRDRIWLIGKSMADPASQRGRGGNAEWQDAKDAWEPSRYPFHRGWDSCGRFRLPNDGIPQGVGRDHDCLGWECGTPRVQTGQKQRAVKLRCLGNSILPIIGTFLGEIILEQEEKE
tara:strand:- start:41 stop:895 length:855 start_codon:yes stop_codon:yes gene_type:complete